MRQLSQDEIDAVFHNREGAAQTRQEKRAVPFDFEKPDRIPKSQLRAIRFLHENFVRSLASSFSAYLRAFSSGNLVSVEQIPYSTFLDGLPANTCKVPLTLMPYGDTAVLEINPSLIFPVLELLLGGKNLGNGINRELTEMERYLLANLFRIVTRDLEQAWKGVDHVEFRLDSLDSKLRSSRTLGPGEAVVAIGMEFRVDEAIGMINLAIPSITMKSMVSKFDEQGTFSESIPDRAEQEHILTMLSRAVVTLEPALTSRISMRDLLTLKSDSVILLGHPVNQLIVAGANGRTKFEGEVISDDGQLGFLISNVRNGI